MINHIIPTGILTLKSNFMHKKLKTFRTSTMGFMVATLASFAFAASAQTFTQNGLVFDVLSATDKTVSVKTSSTAITKADIPENVTNNGVTYTVTEFAAEAFANCSALKEVSIPKSIKVSNTKAFYYCSDLERVNVADPGAFAQIDFAAPNANPVYYSESMYCDGKVVTEVIVPEGATKIGNYSLYYNDPITKVVLPSTVVEFGKSCFDNLPNLVSLNIPPRLTTIGESALSSTMLDSVILPATVAKIGQYSFFRMEQLKKIVIPNTIDTLPYQFLGSTKMLEKFDFSPTLKAIDGFAFCESGLKEVVIPNTVKYIGEQAFSRMSKLTDITIGAGVDSIGKRAFYNTKVSPIAKVVVKSVTPPKCVATNTTWDTFRADTYTTAVLYVPKGSSETYKNTLPWSQFTTIKEYDNTAEGKSITIGNVKYTVTSDAYFKAGASAVDKNIASAEFVEKITLDGYDYFVTSILDNGFENCSNLKSIKIPATITSIGKQAFAGCSSLAKTETDSIQAWMNLQFADAKANPVSASRNLYIAGKELTTLSLPANINKIQDYAFFGCLSLTNLALNNIASFGNKSLAATGLTSVALTDTVASYGYGVFADNLVLDSIYIAAGFTNVPDGIFENCVSLSKANLPASLLSIGRRSFFNTGFTEIKLPDYTSQIGAEAFANCTKLQNVNLHNEVATIGAEAFKASAAITSFTVKGNKAPICAPSANDEILTFDATVYANAKLIVPKTGVDSYKTTLPWKNFNNIIPSEFSGVEERVFTEGNLVYTLISSEDKTVEVKAANEDIPEAIIPASITNSNNGYSYNVVAISASGFKNCVSLKQIVMPISITTIGAGAFTGCEAIDSVKASSLQQWCSIDFADLAANPARVAGALCIDNKVITDLRIPASVKKVANFAFASNKALTSVIMHEAFTEIGQYAFYDCTNLSKANFPASLRIIGPYSFGKCAFTELELPDSATLGESCFRENTSLVSIKLPKGLTVAPNTMLFRCTALDTIIWPDNLKTLEMSAINYTGLKRITLPESVEYINEYALANNVNLEELTIGKNVVGLGKMAVYALKNQPLTKIFCKATTPPELLESEEYGSGDFFTNYVYANAKLYVPKNTIPLYSSAECWKNFTTILDSEFDEVETIGSENIDIRVENGAIILPEGISCAIYSIDGTILFRGTTSTFRPSAKGTYLVAINGKTIKILI